MYLNCIRKWLCTGLIGGAMLFAVQTEAAIVTDLVPILTYSDHIVPTYDNPGGSKKGFISPNVSLIYIKNIRPDGWAYGSYPIAGGKRIYRWFQMQNLQGYNDFENYRIRADYNQTVYRTTSQAAKTGSILSDQDILVVGEAGNLLKVIYKVSSGNEYKMGWIEKFVSNSNESNDDENEEYYEDDGTNDNSSENSSGSRNGNIINIYGGTINTGDIDASVNQNSHNDNSTNDNSTNVVDNSYNDNRSTTNTKNIDNSQHSSTKNIDNRDYSNRSGQGRRNSSTIGDVNRNGKVNILDVIDLLRYLVNETDSVGNKLAADLNQDNKIDNDDVIQLIKNLRTSKTAVGDVNDDGKIDEADLKLLKTHVNGRSNSDGIDKKEADINGDSRINAADVNLLEKLLGYLKTLNLKI